MNNRLAKLAEIANALTQNEAMQTQIAGQRLLQDQSTQSFPVELQRMRSGVRTENTRNKVARGQERRARREEDRSGQMFPLQMQEMQGRLKGAEGDRRRQQMELGMMERLMPVQEESARNAGQIGQMNAAGNLGQGLAYMSPQVQEQVMRRFGLLPEPQVDPVRQRQVQMLMEAIQNMNQRR